MRESGKKVISPRPQIASRVQAEAITILSLVELCRTLGGGHHIIKIYE